MQLTILKGDNLTLLKDYPDNYFDSVVTDCPYGLSAEPDAIKVLQDWIDHGYHEVKSKGGFMGKKWDAFVPQPILWKEVFRVLKPGGHLLAFFGTRTYDWGTIAIRLAGFEIRDMISWIYGQGFPKSLDISKAIDKKNGATREVIGKSSVTGKRKKSSMDDENGKDDRTFSNIEPVVNYKTSASSDEAKEWDGWGTALKPATEPICVAQKPFKSTIVNNILNHGTGGINIDACRIEFKSEDDLKSATFGTGTNIIGGNYVGSKLSDGRKNVEANSDGRWPANIIFDPFMANELDKQTGTLTSGNPSGIRKASNNIYGQYAPGQDVTGYGDSGGASRFFYCAKASQEERNAGCDQLTPNVHPTVKPIALMRYLLRLVTPPGGKTLDCYAGSGTTGCAAYFEDIGEIVLMELDDSGTYIPIIEARTKYWSVPYNRKKYMEDLKDKVVEQPENQMKLF